jgi:hypothetical protein
MQKGAHLVFQEHQRQAAYYRTRIEPSFGFDEISDPLALVEPRMRAKTVDLAQDICRHTFHFRGVEARLDSVDWDYRPQGNLDWTRDLNRHFYFVTLGLAYRYTGESIYTKGFVNLVGDWLAKNGPESAAWACPFEVAARLNAWIWSFFLFRAAPDFTDQDLAAFLDGLHRQVRHLDANIEYHIPTNHLLLEAKALALCGLLFPEWKEAGQWWKKGMAILLAEVERQVCSDGVHGERSTLYHKIITSELSELIWLLYQKGHAIPQPLMRAFERMLEFELHITKPDGTFPLFCDSALTDGYLRFSALAVGAVVLDRSDLAAENLGLNENTIWLLGERGLAKYRSLAAGARPLASRGFPHGGYFVMRGNNLGNGQGSDYYLAIDCGPFGLPLVPDHGHADALSFELFAGGQAHVVDAGVYSYHLGQRWRAYFRGTRAHNTLVVDGQDQSILDGIRHVYRPAKTTLHSWLPGRHFDWLDGSHDGYTRLPEPVIHRRQVLFVKGEYWVLADWALGKGSHRYDLLFHLTPWSNPVLEGSAFKARTGGSTGLAIIPFYPSENEARVVQGEKSPIQGWVSFESGEAVTSPTLEYRMVGRAPARFAVALFPYTSGDELPVLEGHTWPSSDPQTALAASLTFRSWTDYVLATLDPSANLSAGPCETDGGVAFLRWDRGAEQFTRAFLLGGKELIYQSIPMVKASRRLGALELVYHEGHLNVWAESPERCDLAIFAPGLVKATVNGQSAGLNRKGPFINVSLAPMPSGPREAEDERRG